MPNSDFLANKIFDHMLRGQTYAPPATVYAALLTTLPTQSDGTGLVECSASWYTRQAVSWGAAASRTMTNSAQISFTTNASQAVTDTIDGIALYDAATSGNLMRVLRATAGLLIAVGSQVIIPAGQLSLSDSWNL